MTAMIATTASTGTQTHAIATPYRFQACRPCRQLPVAPQIHSGMIAVMMSSAAVSLRA